MVGKGGLREEILTGRTFTNLSPLDNLRKSENLSILIHLCITGMICAETAIDDLENLKRSGEGGIRHSEYSQPFHA